ncbi:AraC family transcriptional regulator [Mediterraneibacter glycyrrhizinilyticus]|uniref:AraC family transcriptional regulator n=1 Tax=Mediterraneibacter glycyrrhizinilyticus TaxID=342942 RepID=UPI0025A38CAA|nr:AraC family transcriptional regulator [Mediterraneibacter glycyrrhizinilyticus]MDM8124519.1 AraC family transcriptional regulator [Mediterraneibacter glycyrrhizinilyticus]
MTYSIYETVSSNQTFPVNVFVAPIENSTFHWHNEYEMIGILKGTINIRVSSESITLNEGDIFLVNSRVIHAIRCIEDEKNLCMILQMSPELFTSEENENSDIRFYLDSTQKDEEPERGFAYFYRNLAQLVYESLKEDGHSPFRIRAQVCAMIADLFDYVIYDVRFRDSVSQNQQELAVSVIEYMEKYLEEDSIVDMACRQFGLSRKSLDRVLKTMTGVTGKEILENLRVERAKSLLKNTDKNMNYILDSCGFGSEKTFYRVFRRETGLTPNEFRHKGQIDQYNEQLKGYLDYEVPEVKEILKKVLE